MDEINQTLRSGTKIRNHNVEILGDVTGDSLQLMDAGFE